MEVVNWRLISHPMNWVVLFLMVFIAMMLVHFVMAYMVSPKTSEPVSS